MKIQCAYCDRTNKAEREDCRGCGANLPDVPGLREIEIDPDNPYFVDGGVSFRTPSLRSDWGLTSIGVTTDEK